MLALDSPRWGELRHAYGGASDIPELLRELEAVAQGRLTPPPVQYDFEREPWFSLWSALCHQGDVDTASYAAVPHLLRIAADAQTGLWEYFALVAQIEIERATHGPDIPGDLIDAYTTALRDIPVQIQHASDRNWDELLSRSLIAALLASKGRTRLAKAVLELNPDEVTRFLEQVGVEAEDPDAGDF